MGVFVGLDISLDAVDICEIDCRPAATSACPFGPIVSGMVFPRGGFFFSVLSCLVSTQPWRRLFIV